MIGDTIKIRQQATDPWGGGLPGQVSNEVTLVKVNQDGYGSEYRYQIPDGGRYVLKVRNSVEPATALRPAYNRHNIELTYVDPADPDVGKPEHTFVYYSIWRVPIGATLDLAYALAYALGYNFESNMKKIHNFES
nr:MAG: putative coat protein [Leviviridae sp.]